MFDVSNMGFMIILVMLAGILLDLIFSGRAMIFAGLTSVYMVTAISNKPMEVEFLRFDTQEIHSTGDNYNSISSGFGMFTWFVESEEMYAGNVKTGERDGGEVFERIYIPVVGTERITNPTLENTAIWNNPICKHQPTWLFYDEREFTCPSEVKKGELQIPKNSIIKQMKFQ